MKYELALKLKEAGFPQNRRDDVKYFCGPGVVMSFKEAKNLRSEYHPIWDSMIIDYQKTFTAIPSLSELIQECGDMFGQLIKYDPDKGHLFVAIGEYPRWEMEAKSKVIRTEPYSAPEEAMSNLYLELKKLSTG